MTIFLKMSKCKPVNTSAPRKIRKKNQIIYYMKLKNRDQFPAQIYKTYMNLKYILDKIQKYKNFIKMN